MFENLCAMMDFAKQIKVNTIFLYRISLKKFDDCAKWTDEASGVY